MRDIFPIIFESDDLLVINKPAGLVCHPTKGDAYSSLIGRVRLYLGPACMAHLINRLDRETSGVVLAAKNSAAAGALGKIWESRAVEKEYLAIVHGTVREPAGVIEWSLGKDETSEVAIKDCVRPDGATARTAFWVKKHFERAEGRFTLLRVCPKTGRKHQIRIHLAALGHPIAGDKLYGADPDAYLAFVKGRLTVEQKRHLLLTNQALHAREMRFQWKGQAQSFQAPAEKEFLDFCEEES